MTGLRSELNSHLKRKLNDELDSELTSELKKELNSENRVTRIKDHNRVRIVGAIYLDRKWIDQEVITKIHRDYSVFEP